MSPDTRQHFAGSTLDPQRLAQARQALDRLCQRSPQILLMVQKRLLAEGSAFDLNGLAMRALADEEAGRTLAASPVKDLATDEVLSMCRKGQR
ncbi:hypothetical protein [Vogesella indigofera]|uniref:hypothetical protein n=1 Tax=Vogesella indigofera TaxID=45465 RepID=UPI003F41DA87